MKKNNISKFGTVAALAALILGTAPKASAGHGTGVAAGIIGLAAGVTKLCPPNDVGTVVIDQTSMGSGTESHSSRNFTWTRTRRVEVRRSR